jgi:TonB family protein
MMMSRKLPATIGGQFFLYGMNMVETIAAGMDNQISNARIQGFRRLVPALLLSAIAHLLLAQCLPDSVKAYEGTPPSDTPLTVSLQSAAPLMQVKIPRSAIPVPLKAAAVTSEPIIPDAVNLIADDQPAPQSPAALAGPSDIPSDQSSEPDAAALPLLDYFYQSREVDTPAKAVGDALLIYPREALRLGVSGEVDLKLFINESGKLVRSEVIRSHPPGIFEEAAVQAVNTMQFSPARRADRPVRSQRTVQITFDPNPAQDPRSATQ